jgi:transcriptional regulator with XRE-family HTH domain
MKMNPTESRHRQQALAKALRFLRLKNNVKRQWLANVLGISVPAYEKIEQGTTRARFIEVVIICEALGASMAELLEHYQREMKKMGGVKN